MKCKKIFTRDSSCWLTKSLRHIYFCPDLTPNLVTCPIWFRNLGNGASNLQFLATFQPSDPDQRLSVRSFVPLSARTTKKRPGIQCKFSCNSHLQNLAVILLLIKATMALAYSLGNLSIFFCPQEDVLRNDCTRLCLMYMSQKEEMARSNSLL